MKKYIEQSTMIAMEIISQDLALNIQEMYENYISQGFGPAEIEDEHEMRYKMTHDDHDFRNLSEAQKREAFSQYWSHHWYTSKKWDMKLMSELGIKANTKRFNLKDKAKHGATKWDHANRTCGKHFWLNDDIIQNRKLHEAMNQKEKDYNPAPAFQLSGFPYIQDLYHGVKHRMSKSQTEVYLEVMDLLTDFDFTSTELDWLRNEIDYLYNKELEKLEKIKANIDHCLNKAKKYLSQAEVAKKALQEMLDK